MALGGRNWEGFSPDPYLTGVAFSLSVQGMQATGAQACGKHYIGNEQENQRNPTTNQEGETILAISSNIDDRTMHELYLPPFADAVKIGMASIMCSYNRLNQTYACENSKILNGLLKGELGFQGYVVSDWGATHSGLPAITAGLDMDMPGTIRGSTASYFGMNITQAVQNGSLPESRLDDMVLRVMTPYYFLQQNSGYPTVDPSSAELNNYNPANSNYTWDLSGEKSRDVRDDNAQLIRKLGAEATVLLKNTGSLPLKSPKNIAVFGNDAPDVTTGLYNQAVYRYSASEGFDIGTLAVGGGSGAGRFTYLVSPLDAIKTRAQQDGALVQYITSNDYNAFQASKIYPPPEVCVVFLKTWVTEGYDRAKYEADWNSTGLVNSVTSVCNNTIVVTHSGGINTMPWADNDNITAILAAHFPGQESGNSIVDVLYGDVNPSGRLPYTIAMNGSDYNTQIINITNTNDTDPNAWQDNFEEGLMIDYRYFDSANVTPMYEFGFGLSYTTFEMGQFLQVEGDSGLSQYPEAADTEPGGNPNVFATVATVTAQVTNNGTVPGATVPQLYVSLPQDGVPDGTPVKTLHGFEKVMLQPGETQSVQFALTRRDVSYWDTNAQDWAIPEGAIQVMVGFSSRDLPVHASMTLR
jgi:beta-glucosidase